MSTDRDEYILKRLSEGAVYREIGEECNLTRARVQQIAKGLGHTHKTKSERIRRILTEAVAVGLTVGEAATLAGCSYRNTSYYLAQLGLKARRKKRPGFRGERHEQVESMFRFRREVKEKLSTLAKQQGVSMVVLLESLIQRAWEEQ